jgi:hypothetical protein
METPLTGCSSPVTSPAVSDDGLVPEAEHKSEAGRVTHTAANNNCPPDVEEVEKITDLAKLDVTEPDDKQTAVTPDSAATNNDEAVEDENVGTGF